MFFFLRRQAHFNIRSLWTDTFHRALLDWHRFASDILNSITKLSWTTKNCVSQNCSWVWQGWKKLLFLAFGSYNKRSWHLNWDRVAGLAEDLVSFCQNLGKTYTKSFVICLFHFLKNVSYITLLIFFQFMSLKNKKKFIFELSNYF